MDKDIITSKLIVPVGSLWRTIGRWQDEYDIILSYNNKNKTSTNLHFLVNKKNNSVTTSIIKKHITAYVLQSWDVNGCELISRL